MDAEKDRTDAGPPLFVEGGPFEHSAKVISHAAYRLLWGTVWKGASTFPMNGPVLLVSNHPSYLDPLGIYVGAPRRVHWMAWEALFDVPLMGPFIRKAGAFPVNDLTTDTRAMRRAGKVLKAGEVVGIFPEGGRSLPTGEMFPFLTSPFRFALRFSCPIVPVTVNGAGRIWPRGRVLPRPGGGIEITYHRPMDAPSRSPSGPGRASVRAAGLAREAREIILGAYRAPEGILGRSRRTWALDPAQHPVVRADRAGLPLLEWAEKHWK